MLLSYDNNKPFNPIARLKEFFSWIENITGSEIRKAVFFYFLENKVATAPILNEALGKKRRSPSVFRELKTLLELEIIEKIVRARYIKKIPGRTPTIYGLKGKWKPDDVVGVIEKHRILNSPNFIIVRNISQTIMDGYLAKYETIEINLNEIVAICKGSCPGFYSFDIADQVASCLSRRGIKVWR